jgi:protein TonB
MRIAILASLAGHAVALAALATIDWHAADGTPAIPVAVLMPPSLGDQASAPSPSTSAPPPPSAAVSAPATASGEPSFDLASALADLPRPTDLPPPKPRAAHPNAARHIAKPAPASAAAAQDGETSSASPVTARGSDVASTEPATAPVVEHGPSVLPGNPRPAYPPAARRRSFEGRAVVRATVTAEGQVASVELRQSSSHDSLDQAALDAVRRWRFTPARRGEQAIAGAVDVPVVFRLED